MKYFGSCHCERIKFEVEAPEVVEVEDCNCSICTMSGFLHLIVPKSKFRLISGVDDTTEYIWGTGVAKHIFCKVCGIKPYYIPRSNPDGYDVNVRCLKPQPRSIVVTNFDGQEWESNAQKLAHKSKE